MSKVEFDNPFVGPRTFQEGDGAYFFGREKEAHELLSLIVSEPVVLFYATSGAGKSSLLNTSIIPGLRTKGFTVLPIGRLSGTLPGQVKDFENIFVFNLLLSLDEEIEPAQLAHTSLHGYLHDLRARSVSKDEDLVLIVDQFEEILKTHLDRWFDREGFFNQVSHALKRDPHLWIVFALREDSVSGLDPYARILPDNLRARYYMQLLDSTSAQKAIKEPARLAGREFDPRAAEALVDNLRRIYVHNEVDQLLGEFVEPLQLQVVCRKLWENLRESKLSKITIQDIQVKGNVDTALASYYEDIVAGVTQSSQSSEITLRTWCENELITETKTRNIVIRGKDKTAGLENEVVDLLANQNLIRSVLRAGGIWYELVHDRLIGPIIQANHEWRLRQSQLTQAALSWQESGDDESKLYVGSQLAEALLNSRDSTLQPLEARFLAKSKELNQKKLDEEQQREQELETAQELARAANRQRNLIVGLFLVFLLLVAAVSIAWWSFAKQRDALSVVVAATATRYYVETRSACLADADVAHSLLNNWDPEELGCATSKADVTYAAWQPFQNGQFMLWREDTNEIYVFYKDQSGNAIWNKYPDEFSGQPMRTVPPITPVPGQASRADRPTRGFGYLWDNKPELAIALGWPTFREQGFCALLQEFEYGVILQSDARRCSVNPNEASSLYEFGLQTIIWIDSQDIKQWEMQ